MRVAIADAFKSWEKFWLHGGSPLSLSFFRFVFCAVLTVCYAVRLINLDLFYSFQGGFFSPEQARDYVSELYPTWFSLIPESDNLMRAFVYAHVIGLLGLTLGLIGRHGTWIVFLLHVSILQRNHAAAYGVDTVSVFFLFYLSLAKHDEHFTLIRKKAKVAMDMLSRVAFRFMQVHVCIVYGFSGLEKLRGPSWWDGSAIWNILGNASLVPFDMSFLAHVPWLVATMTLATVVFEVYFPLAVVMKPSRNVFLWIGVVMHLGIGVLMGLYSFSLMMLSSYLLFIGADQLSSWAKWNKRVSTFARV